MAVIPATAGSTWMPEVTGADPDLDLSAAYRALERRRDRFIGERERIASELIKLDAALDALRPLVGTAPEPEAVDRPGAEAFTAELTGRSAAARMPPVRHPKGADRRVRIIELLLENSRQWLTATEIASLVEGGKTTAGQRNAVSEAMRRLLRHGDVERDETSRPVRYRAIPAALRELLLGYQ
jgi:hypothetical protein